MNDLSTVDKGDATEAAVIAKLKKRGLAVLTPFGDNQRYDIVIDASEKFVRAQVKTAREVSDGKVKFSTSGNRVNSSGNTKKPYNSDKVDIFIAYNSERDTMYRVPVEEAPNSSMIIRHKSKQNQPQINWAEEYVW